MVTGSNEDLAATASDAIRERRLAHGRADRLAIGGRSRRGLERLEGRTHRIESPPRTVGPFSCSIGQRLDHSRARRALSLRVRARTADHDDGLEPREANQLADASPRRARSPDGTYSG